MRYAQKTLFFIAGQNSAGKPKTLLQCKDY